MRESKSLIYLVRLSTTAMINKEIYKATNRRFGYYIYTLIEWITSIPLAILILLNRRKFQPIILNRVKETIFYFALIYLPDSLFRKVYEELREIEVYPNA